MPPTPDEVLEGLYRKEFGLTWHQMQDEPADAVWEWLTVENCRMKQQEMQSRLHPNG
jgi:hypothetical protein